MKLSVGGGRSKKEGYLNLDLCEGADIQFDLDTCAANKIPLEDNSVEHFECLHVLEHINNILPLMEELHRIAKPYAIMDIAVPYGWTNAAFEDPTHVRSFLPYSCVLFGQPAYRRSDYGYRGDWRVLETGILVDKKVAQQLTDVGLDLDFAVKHMVNIAVEMRCSMEAVKPIRDPFDDYDKANLSIHAITTGED